MTKQTVHQEKTGTRNTQQNTLISKLSDQYKILQEFKTP
jgi:hypothetical protein